MDIEVKLPPDFEEHIASIKWSLRPFANRICSKLTTFMGQPAGVGADHRPFLI
jgi:hypothetical protein